MSKVWECKIGFANGELPIGADGPLRDAVKAAYRELVGSDPEFTFSGWGGTLTELEQAVLDNRLPADPMAHRDPLSPTEST